MSREMLALSFGFAVLIAATEIANAQAACAPREVVAERLASAYGETRQAAGLAANNALLEIYAAPGTGTWTITVTTPGGPTCLVASGDNWEAIAEPLPAPGKDA